MKHLSIVIGALAIAIGVLWLGQGLGVIDWPRSSVMIGQRPWVVRGAGLAVAGAVLILWVRRR